ncbi:adenosylmethionine decarboxylase [Phragmitibacter flavus]|uniref:S-adenosylmethionine decarboxylase proenzyme n=1 Tax=Phragmitibacter flavus TaxID=2576071 RepID=A0A5R8KG25_9BACT|nr:adenosylmethionine decarboxylase [Phragmitibacter flavus]TLD71240.1 adenosylmethionine decarboxylase [Phragmitibacter flavus]
MIFGTHLLMELHGCPADRLVDVEWVRRLMLEAVRVAGGTYVTDVFHHFAPLGVSGVIVIAESHATVHTWPEHGYAAVDVFTCGAAFQHDVFVEMMRAGLVADRVQTRVLSRGDEG